MLQVFLIVLVGVLHVSGQFQSPCPDVFDYKIDEQGVYGLVRVKPKCHDAQLLIKVSFTVASRLQNNFVGSIKPLGDYTINSCAADQQPIEYRVNFPISKPIPRITKISANDNTICNGPGDEIDIPNKYVSTINLEHIIYFKAGTSAEFQQKTVHQKIVTPELVLEQHAFENKFNISYGLQRTH